MTEPGEPLGGEDAMSDQDLIVRYGVCECGAARYSQIRTEPARVWVELVCRNGHTDGPLQEAFRLPAEPYSSTEGRTLMAWDPNKTEPVNHVGRTFVGSDPDALTRIEGQRREVPKNHDPFACLADGGCECSCVACPDHKASAVGEPKMCASCRHWDGPWPDQRRWGSCDQVSSPNHDRSHRFFAQDPADYSADLKTREDFGCVEWESKP